MMDELTIALLTSEFGQVWARYDFVSPGLQNCIRLCKSWFTKSHKTLGNMLYKITYDFVSPGLQNHIRFWVRSHKTLGKLGQDRTRSDKIWYDVTNLKSHMHSSGSQKFWKLGNPFYILCMYWEIPFIYMYKVGKFLCEMIVSVIPHFLIRYL